MTFWQKLRAMLHGALLGAAGRSDQDPRDFREVLLLHRHSAESMRDTYSRIGDRAGYTFEKGFIAGLERAAEVYSNWKARQ